jgi:predicted nucleic acid-binding protein
VRELEAGLEEGYRFCRELLDAVSPRPDKGWLRPASLVDAEVGLLADLPATLHAGVASCFVMARNRGWLFLTDDRSARREATRLGVAVSGTLGCLVAGIRRRHWTVAQADDALRRMTAAGYFSPVARIEELLE